MNFSLGFTNNITTYAYATPTKEFACFFSVLAGILICKIVYEATGVVSLSLFKGYAKLSSPQKLEWNNRGFSTFHAFFVAFASIYILFLSDLFKHTSEVDPITYRASTLSDTALGISLGYFLSDLAMILWNFPSLGGMEYVLHHGLSMFSIIQSIVSGQAQFYILMVLFTETTTPSVNLRWYLDVAGQKKSKLYTCNGIALFLGWLGARILWFVFFFYHMFNHFDQVQKIYPLGFYSMLTVPPALAIMNLFWFWKITKGMIKTLTKARHSV
ncbi:uncharacterized protein LOC141698489 [Apium graveolens]|uniref:uncharacterized protein LOC141698489 n=1 Tax=Apium graveolens TaxID=4045 RepID=UPI003D7AB484